MNLFERTIRVEESYEDSEVKESRPVRMYSPLHLLRRMFREGGELSLVEGKAGALFFSADTGNLGIFVELRIEMPADMMPHFLDLYDRLRRSKWISEFAKRREDRFYVVE